MESRRKSSVVEVERANDGVLRVNDENIRRMSVNNPDIAAQTADARQATANEHALTIRDALRLYPKAVAFSILYSTAIVMEGYDTALMGNFYAFMPFRSRYGDQTDPETGNPIISAPWQAGISNGVQVGSIIGLYLNGIISEKFGYKKTMMGSLILMIAFIFIPFFSQNLPTFLVGGVLQGVPWGVFQTLTTTYASEIAPMKLRSYLTTYVNLCWVMGQLIAAGVLRGFLERSDQWAYRVPFAIQWIWPVPILIGTIFAPESPWWLVRKGRYEDAKKSLLALTSPKSGIAFDADEQVAMMKATNELEMSMSKGASYLDCFRGFDLRRTEIASMAWLCQAWCGGAMMGFSTQFFQAAGLAEENSFNMALGQYAMGAVGTIGSWFLMLYAGRRMLYISGLAIMLGLLLIIGFCGIPTNNTGASWAIGALLLVYTFVYDITVGPVCYSLVAEIPSTRLKIKTVALARNFYNIGGIINNVLMPNMLGLRAWNWGAKSGFFWAGACGLLLTWCYFRLPEPKGRTYGELDVLFEHKVSARKFAKTKVDQFAGENTEIVTPDSESETASAEKADVLPQTGLKA